MNPDWLVSSGRSSGATPISRLISARSNHRVGQLQAEVKLCFVLAVSSKYSDYNNACRRPPLTFGVFSWLCLHFHSFLPPTAVVGLADSASTQRRRLAIRRILSNSPTHCGGRMRRDLYTWLGSEIEYVHVCAVRTRARMRIIHHAVFIDVNISVVRTTASDKEQERR